jgi:uncharacterized protein (DUF302 family)
MENTMNGLSTIQSDFGPKETMDRLEADVKSQGMRVFARVNHAALATEAGQTLRPTELLIFGNPRAGTPLMQANQTIGIDLPLKMLVWQDVAGKTWLGYNKPEWLAERHGLGLEKEKIIEMLTLALGAFAMKVTRFP